MLLSMMPAERLVIWDDARLAWTHDVEEVITPIQQGRDEADRKLPPCVPSSVYRLDAHSIIDDLNGDAPMLVFLREQTAQGAFCDASIITGPQA